MRTVLLAGVLALLVHAGAAAAPITCPVDNLAAYTALGPEGCSIGAAVLNDFAVAPGATIDPANVLVTPIASASTFGLSFGVDETAGAGVLLGLLLRYTVTAALVGANLLTMAGAAATGDGVVTAIEEKCLGAFFGGDHPSAPCADRVTHIALVSALDTIVPPPASFTTPSFFDVFTELVIDGGPAGTAVLRGTVTNEFQTESVPEPATLVLLGCALAAASRRRRS
jgi:hypothetical protein